MVILMEPLFIAGDTTASLEIFFPASTLTSDESYSVAIWNPVTVCLPKPPHEEMSQL